MSLLDEAPLDLAEARIRLAGLRTTIRRRASIGLALVLVGAALLAFGRERLGIPLLIGAAAAALLVGLGRDDRRRLLVRLVAQGDAGSIDEVAEAARRLVSPAERRRLARGLRHAVEGASIRRGEFSVADPYRAADSAERLRRLASAIADETVPLGASGAALCRRLLAEGRLSPLYNPRIDEADLDRIIDRIEREMARRALDPPPRSER